MLDELKMIQGVFESQSSIQSSMVSINKTCTLPEFSTHIRSPVMTTTGMLGEGKISINLDRHEAHIS